MRVAGVAFLATLSILAVVGSAALAFQDISPEQFARVTAFAHNLPGIAQSLRDLPANARAQVAAASSLPWLDTFADTLYRTVCPLLRDCPRQETSSEPQPQLQTTSRTITATTTSSLPARAAAPAAVPQTIVQQPVIERIRETVRTVTEPGTNTAYVDARIAALAQSLQSQIAAVSATQTRSGDSIVQLVGMMGRIDNLSGTTITNPTITGGTITAASITGTISNAISSALATITDLTVTTIVATNATTSRLDALDYVAVGRTATTTIRGDGTASTLPFASSTAISVSGTASTTALIISNAGGSGTRCLQVAADGTVSANASACGGSGASPGGSDTYVQFNDASNFGGNGTFTFNKTTGRLALSLASSSQQSILDALYVGRTATTTVRGDGAASILPYASSTALTVSGTGYFGAASTTALTVSGAPGGILKTNASGVVSPASAGTDYVASVTGDWTGTLDGFEASALIAAGFSTTSANYWQTTRNFFSTTSADYWETQQTARTADDLTNNSIEDLNDVAAITENYGDLFAWNGSAWTDFATSSLAVALSDTTGTLGASRGGTGLSSITAGGILLGNYAGTGWQQLATSTLGILTTHVAEGSNQYYTDARVQSFVHASTTIPKTYSANTFTALQTFGNASTTNLSASYASSTLYYGAGLANCSSGNMLTWTNGQFGCEDDSTGGGGASFGQSWEVFSGTYLAPTTTLGIIVSASSTFSGGVSIDRSTTTAATTTSLAVTSHASSSNLTVSNNFTLGTLTGFLKATAGSVATALINLASDVTGILPVANGGTGWSNIASGALVLGNGTGPVATTSAGTNGQVLALVGGTPTWVATTTLATISGTLSGTQLDGVFSSNGLLARTTTGTYASRTLTGTSNQITVSNGDGVSGNPTLSLPSLLAITQASSTQQSVLDAIYIGRTATTTIRGGGLASTLPYASTTALTVSGTAYFPGSGIWNSSGNVGIGTTTPQSNVNLDLYGGTASVLRLSEGDVANGNTFLVEDANNFEIRRGTITSGAAVYVSASGNTGFQDSHDTARITVGQGASGAHALRIYDDAARYRAVYLTNNDTTIGFTNGVNTATLSDSGVWGDASDISIKKNIVDMSRYGLSTTLALRPVEYEMISSGEAQIGFIAQEIKSLIPEIVTGADGSMTLAYSHLTPVLAKAIQELNFKLEDLATTTSDMEEGSFPFRFFAALKDRLIAWFADATNGINEFFAGRGHFQEELCVGDVCVTRDEFLRMKQGQSAAAGASALGAGDEAPAGSSTSGEADADTATSTTPVSEEEDTDAPEQGGIEVPAVSAREEDVGDDDGAEVDTVTGGSTEPLPTADTVSPLSTELLNNNSPIENVPGTDTL